MLTDDFPFLLPRHIENDLPAKLRSLANDLERIHASMAPSDNELAAAPSIREWRVVLSAGGLRLTGLVSGHPRLGERVAMTSQIWAADGFGRWVRTLSRFYNLGEADEAPSPGHTDDGDRQQVRGGLRDV